MLKVISFKSIERQVSRLTLVEYTNSLTYHARYSPGFLYSDSYWIKTDNNCKIATISCWKSSTDWKNWYSSSIRKNIEKSYKNNNIKQDFFELKKQKFLNDDIFLL